MISGSTEAGFEACLRRNKTSESVRAMDRIRELQKRLRRERIDLAIVMQPRDLYYYSGTAQPCNLVVPAAGEPLLFVRRAWEFVIEETDLAASQVLRGAGLPEIHAVLKSRKIPEGRIAVTEDAIPAGIYKKVQATFRDSEIVDLSPLVLEQRMIKDAEELQSICRAADMFRYAHQAVLEFLRPGVTEVQLAARVLEKIRENGGESIVRNRRWDASLPPEGLVVSRANMWKISGHAMTITGVGLSRSLPWGASGTAIQPGDLVILDMGINRQGYHADIARTYVAGGASSEQREVFGQVLAIQQAVLDKIRPGIAAGELYAIAAAKAAELGRFEFFQGFDEMKGRYIGHGLGLELDEPPTLDGKNGACLRPGMVLAIEPKLIIPGFGGVVLEDDVIVTEDGYRLITPVESTLFEVFPKG